MKTELNNVAIWQPTTVDEITIREFPEGRQYFEDSIQKISEEKMFRYAKNYNNDNVSFCLFIATFENNKKLIENFLDNIAKNLKKEEITNYLNDQNDNFDYLDRYYKGEK